MRLARRVQKLEQTETLNRHLSPLEQFARALNDSAIRMTGKEYAFVAADDERAQERILADVVESFYEKLSRDELRAVLAELEALVFSDPAELAAAKREVLGPDWRKLDAFRKE
jgi:hypothetical protein